MKTLDVVAGIIWADGRYLAVERPEGARMAGWWEFPGGKIEPGETPEAALKRELREELGLTAQSVELWRETDHEYEEFTVHLRFFHVRSWRGGPEAREGQRMAWVDPTEPCELGFLPADIGIVEALHHEFR